MEQSLLDMLPARRPDISIVDKDEGEHWRVSHLQLQGRNRPAFSMKFFSGDLARRDIGLLQRWPGAPDLSGVTVVVEFRPFSEPDWELFGILGRELMRRWNALLFEPMEGAFFVSMADSERFEGVSDQPAGQHTTRR